MALFLWLELSGNSWGNAPDAGGKIQTAINALGPGGGVVDARNLTGAQTISSTVTIPYGITLILGAATFTSYANPAFKIAPASGTLSANLIGGAGGALNTVIVNTVAGGTAVQITSDMRFILRNLNLKNSGTGVTTGLSFTSLGPNAGSSTGPGLTENVEIDNFTNGVSIGTSGNLAASELIFSNLELESNSVGVLIQGASSVNFHFQGLNAVNHTSAALRVLNTYPGTITVERASLSSNAIDFDLQTNVHFYGYGIYTEGATWGAKFLNTAVGGAGAAPIWVSFEQVEDQRSSAAASVAAWPGSYTFRNVNSEIGLTVGDSQANNRYHVEITGGRMPDPAYAGGSNSLVYVSVARDFANGSNNQSVQDFEESVFLVGGKKRTLYTYPWSGHPTAAIPTALPTFSNGLSLGCVPFSSLGTPANGALFCCSDCTIANPCASGGTGAVAKRLNGVWVCN